MSTNGKNDSSTSQTIVFDGQTYNTDVLPPRLAEILTKYSNNEGIDAKETLGQELINHTFGYSDHRDVAHSVVKNVVWITLGSEKDSNVVATPNPIVCDQDID